MISSLMFLWHSIVAISSATPVISHCSPEEVVVFNCETNGKTASLCASKGAGGEWQAQYRYGYQGIIEQAIPNRPIPTMDNFIYEWIWIDQLSQTDVIKLITDENYLDISVDIEDHGEDEFNNSYYGSVNGQKCTGPVSLLKEDGIKNIGIKEYDKDQLIKIYDHHLLMAHLNFQFHKEFFENLTNASDSIHGQSAKECYSMIDYTYEMFDFDDIVISPRANGFYFKGVLGLGVSCDYYRTLSVTMTTQELRPFLLKNPTEVHPHTTSRKTEKEIIDEFMSGLDFGENSDSGSIDGMGGTANLDANMQGGLGGIIGAKGVHADSDGLGASGGGDTADDVRDSRSGRGSSGYGKGGGAVDKKRSVGSVKSGGTPIILGALDKSLIDAVIKRNMNQIRYCYQRELIDNPGLNGKIIVKFTIAPDGSVSRSSIKTSTMGNPAVENCITGRFKRFKFPEPKGGGVVIVSYPFIFGE